MINILFFDLLVQGNNEVVLWDTGARSKLKTLWASDAPALSSDEDPKNKSVLGMVAVNCKDTDALITCGSDMAIRYWDLHSPSRSYLISDSPKFPLEPSLPTSMIKSSAVSSSISYESKLMDGIHVIQEHRKNYEKRSETSTFSNLASGGLIWDQQTVSLTHKTIITDLAWISKLNLLISSSGDGVVKLWR